MNEELTKATAESPEEVMQVYNELNTLREIGGLSIYVSRTDAPYIWQVYESLLGKGVFEAFTQSVDGGENSNDIRSGVRLPFELKPSNPRPKDGIWEVDFNYPEFTNAYQIAKRSYLSTGPKPKADSSGIDHISKLKVVSSSYDPANSALNLLGTIVVIQKQNKGKGIKNSGTAEAQLMKKIFSVNPLSRGVDFYRILSVRQSEMTPKHTKRVKNYVAAINRKVKAVGGPPDLILFTQTSVAINKSYL